MLHRVMLHCQVKGEARPIFDWGALLHGVLLHSVPPRVGDKLHSGERKPFAQYIEPLGTDTFIWRIHVWEDEIAAAIGAALLPLQSFVVYPDNEHLNVSVLRSEQTRLPADELIWKANSETNFHYTVRFVSPTSHKIKDVYINYPTPELLYRNLCQRVPEVIGSNGTREAGILEALCAGTQVTRYRLWSVDYRLKNNNAVIPAYMGEMDMLIKGHIRVKRLGAVLLMCALDMGVGIKTAMGMGGCVVSVVGREDTLNF